MVLGWFTRTRKAAPPRRVPDGRAVYAIGDVHGRDDLLAQLLLDIASDAARHPAEARPLLIFLGDYIDRGSRSREVVERLVNGWPDQFDRVTLMGNHEAALLAFIDEGSHGAAWLQHGGLETLLSYGVHLRKLPASADELAELRGRVIEQIPSHHIDYLRSCVLWHSEGDYLFVHAGIRPGVPLEHQTPEDLLWIRNDFLRSRSDHGGRMVVHGHTICSRPEVLRNRINLDTGAYVTGHLTALVLRHDRQDFLAT